MVGWGCRGLRVLAGVGLVWGFLGFRGFLRGGGGFGGGVGVQGGSVL